MKPEIKEEMISEWTTAPGVPALSSEHTHVWLLQLDEDLCRLVENSLSKPELERAAAFRFPLHRNEFVLARGSLRFLLGRYLSIEPRSILIGSEERGKPFLPSENASGIQFNISHSSGYAVFCFIKGESVGIDIERHTSDCIDQGMLQQCLSAGERNRYRDTPADGQMQFFFDTWVRKEAYMKLIGDGLNIPPNEFSLSSIDTSCDIVRGENIHFTSLPAIMGYSAAMATTNEREKVEYYRLGSNLLM